MPNLPKNGGDKISLELLSSPEAQRYRDFGIGATTGVLLAWTAQHVWMPMEMFENAELGLAILMTIVVAVTAGGYEFKKGLAEKIGTED